MYIQKRNTSNQNNGIKILCTLHITIICTCMACPSGYSAQECSEPHFRTKICPAPPTHTKSLGGSCPAVCKCKPHELSKVTVFLDPARQNPILVSPRVFNPNCRRFLWARAAANKNSRIRVYAQLREIFAAENFGRPGSLFGRVCKVKMKQGRSQSEIRRAKTLRCS
jgi:hypothetical protein